MTLRQIDILINALNKRQWKAVEFDASLHDKKLKNQAPIEAEELSEKQKQHLDKALEDAMARKREQWQTT